MGAGWPSQSNTEQETVKQLGEAQETSAGKISDLFEGTPYLQDDGGEDLSYCNVWIGSSAERQEYMDETPSWRIKSEDDESHLMSTEAGITLIYMP
jgi:phospholipase A2